MRKGKYMTEEVYKALGEIVDENASKCSNIRDLLAVVAIEAYLMGRLHALCTEDDLKAIL